jgi:hypothetical protein
MKPFSFVLLSLCSISVLSACSKTKEQFDFSKKAPDEFAVVKRAPLEMPTSIKLPPPRPGAPRPQEAASTDQAKQILFGRTENTATQPSTSSESILLQRAGANNVSADIRDVVDAETLESREDSISTFDKIIGRNSSGSSSTNVIDPKEELKRLEAQQQN